MTATFQFNTDFINTSDKQISKAHTHTLNHSQITFTPLLAQEIRHSIISRTLPFMPRYLLQFTNEKRGDSRDNTAHFHHYRHAHSNINTPCYLLKHTYALTIFSTCTTKHNATYDVFFRSPKIKKLSTESSSIIESRNAALYCAMTTARGSIQFRMENGCIVRCCTVIVLIQIRLRKKYRLLITKFLENRK